MNQNKQEIYVKTKHKHYSDVIMGAMASQITILMIVFPTVYSGADHRKQQSSASMAFVRGIHRWPVNSPHKWPVTRKMFPFNDVIMTKSKADASQNLTVKEIHKTWTMSHQGDGSFYHKVNDRDISRVSCIWKLYGRWYTYGDISLVIELPSNL